VISENNLTDIFNETIRNQLHELDLAKSFSLLNEKAKFKIKQLGFTYDNGTKNFDFTNAYNIIDCKLNGYPHACVESYLYYNKDYGNCRVINSDLNSSGYPIDTTSINFAGRPNGLSVTMFLGVVAELKDFEPNFGLAINIENGSNGIIRDPIEIPAGYETNIVLEREFRQQLAYPYSNCDLDNDSPASFDRKYYDILAEMNIKYKESVCVDLCYQTLLKDACNCTNESVFSLYDDLGSCFSTEQLQFCQFKFDGKFLYDNITRDACKPPCPLECNQTIFNTRISSSKLNLNYYSMIIDKFAVNNEIIDKNESLSLEDKTNSIIKFNIYYESMSYKKTTESISMDIVALLSNIGGTLGLFLGVSLLTAVELVDIILQAILIFFQT
jgi:hypothetical protein